MMIKVQGGYLDFNDDIEVERQAKVFEELSKTAGDFSYEFEVELTGNNISLLELPFPDNIQKNVYHKISADLVGNDGNNLYKGFIRIERIVGRIAFCSFFSGNNNWFGMLSGSLYEIDFSDLDVEQTESNIVASWSQDSGVVFPLVDNNVLMQRQAMNLKIEDFVPTIYVHTVLKRIFQKHSIKLQGELFRDTNYRRLIITRSPDDQIESRSAYVSKNTPQSVGVVPELLTFDDDFTAPFFDGSQDNYKLASSEYDADVRMRLKIDVSVTYNDADALSTHTVFIVKNGSEVKSGGFNGAGIDFTYTISHELIMEPGDNITISARSTIVGDIVSATVRFTPTFLYVAYGNAAIPNWTQQDFVSNIFRLFNTLSYYEPVTRTLTVNLFEKIKDKDAIDISEFISESETDYVDVVSAYGKESTATYDTTEFDDWEQNGIKNYFASGDGSIQIDNDFIEDSKDFIESDFTNSQAYINPVFDMSIERLKTLEMEVLSETNSGSVADSSGMARFSVDDDIFAVGDLVRISDTPITSYLGDWIVSVVGSGYVEFYNLAFEADTTAKVSVMKHVYTGDDNVYLLFNIPNYQVSKFSSANSFRLETTERSSMAIAYFNMLYMGRQVNEDFNQSLSFGDLSSMFAYQRTLIDTYWRLAEGILNDPVKQITTCNLPHTLFVNLDFLKPISIRTIESSNLYYPTKVSGYRGKEFDSVVELIKLP